MKKIQFSLILLSAVLLFACSGNKKGLYEEDAIAALDNLTQVMGQLESCSFTLNTSTLVKENGDDPVYKMYDMYMRGSHKMHFYSVNDDNRVGLWYNGEELAVLNYDTNQYDVMDAPATIMETINLFHTNLKVNFPAADFFYPTLTDDLIEHCDTVIVSGTKVIDDIQCTEINATNKNVDIYILIEQETNLPKALAVYYIGDKKGDQYLSLFSNWRTNPNLPDDIFKFSPSENVSKASLFNSKLLK